MIMLLLETKQSIFKSNSRIESGQRNGSLCLNTFSEANQLSCAGSALEFLDLKMQAYNSNKILFSL